MKLAEKLLKFHFYYKAFVAFIIAHFSDLMVSEAQKDILSDDWDDWDDKFTAYTTPDTHNTPSISDINAAYELYAPRMEAVRVQIRDNTAITLNGIEMSNLNIKMVDKNPTKVLPPNYAPSIGLVSVGSLTVNLFVFDPTHTGSKAKPPGAKFIGSKVAFTGVDAGAPALTEYSTRVPEGKTTFPILYSSDKVGKKMWIICWYMSPTGKPGPVSEAFSVVLT